MWALTLIIGCCVSLVTLLTSTALKLPKYYFFFSLLAFVGACSWINLLANEVVAVLQTIGVTWNVSTGPNAAIAFMLASSLLCCSPGSLLACVVLCCDVWCGAQRCWV